MCRLSVLIHAFVESTQHFSLEFVLNKTIKNKHLRQLSGQKLHSNVMNRWIDHPVTDDNTFLYKFAGDIGKFPRYEGWNNTTKSFKKLSIDHFSCFIMYISIGVVNIFTGQMTLCGSAQTGTSTDGLIATSLLITERVPQGSVLGTLVFTTTTTT